jgi:hypothetical protein
MLKDTPGVSLKFFVQVTVVLGLALCHVDAFARDPLTGKHSTKFGVPSPGLGQLVKDLPNDHPVRIVFNTMLREIVQFGGHAVEANLGPYIFAQHNPVDVNLTVFRYNSGRLRAVDALEEIVHWQQIKAGGAYWRDYSQHPLFIKFNSKALIMEDLAKRSMLGRKDLSPLLRDELKHDLRAVSDARYGVVASCERLADRLSIDSK